jgi:fructuronate reductase
VDRITPRTTAAEIEWVREHCGFEDASPVVTEPFHSWVLSGDFPAGRPRWEEAGAQFVEDIAPYENRKLWLLNGSHSLLAYAGQQRGHRTVADALSDPQCAEWMEAFWNEAEAHLPPDTAGYRAALRERYSNTRISHNLAQIAIDGSSKLRIRAIPVLRAERGAGRDGVGSARLIAAWIAFLESTLQSGHKINDASMPDIHRALSLRGGERTKSLVGLLDARLSEDESLLEMIETLVRNHLPESSRS